MSERKRQVKVVKGTKYVCYEGDYWWVEVK